MAPTGILPPAMLTVTPSVTCGCTIGDVGARLREWERFLRFQGASERTVVGYRRALGNLLMDLGTCPDELGEADILGYCSGFDAHGPKRGMVLRAAKSFYAFEAPRGRGNPAARLRVPREKYRPAPSLAREDLNRVLVAAFNREPRRAAAILFILLTGARLTSACSVRPEDVQGDRVLFRVAKGGDQYAVPLDPFGRLVVECLRQAPRPPRSSWRGSRWHEGLIGVGPTRVEQWVDEAEAATGIGVWPHLLRHTFATAAVEQGTDPRVLMELMGWKDLSQFRRYVAARDDRVRAAVGAVSSFLAG